jgi:Zn-dependent protease
MYKTIKIGRIKTSRIELVDIAKAWLAISLAFAFVYSGASLLSGDINKLFSLGFFWIFLVSLFTAGLGFLLHELAHKFAAQKYGCVAEFRAFDQMLYVAVGLAAFVGFIFAAPGAVMISGRVTTKENGVISLAGPITNYILAIVFFILMIMFPISASFKGTFVNPFLIGFSINFWLGLFNLIPFGNFDGIKIFHWNKLVWVVMVFVGMVGTNLFGLRNIIFGF